MLLTSVSLTRSICLLVMEETGGDGIGRLFEATGAEALINNCFSLLRYVEHVNL